MELNSIIITKQVKQTSKDTVKHNYELQAVPSRVKILHS